MTSVLNLDTDEIIEIESEEIEQIQLHIQLSIDYITQLTHASDLSRLTTLTLTNISTQHTSLQCINSSTLSSLISLTINQSNIDSIREFGRDQWNTLCTLDLSYCNLNDIDNISIFPHVRSLNLSYNHLVDITSMEELICINQFSCDGNNINNMDQIDFLYNCINLESLSLLYNPVTYLQHYRSVVIHKLSHTQLYRLDTLSIINADRIEVDESLYNIQRSANEIAQIKFEHELYVKNNSHMYYIDSHKTVIQQQHMEQFISNFADTDLLSIELQDKLRSTVRPSTGGSNSSRPSTSPDQRNSSTLNQSIRPSTSLLRPSSSMNRPSTSSSMRPGTSSIAPELLSTIALGSSELTFGGDVLAGNFITAMRQRKRTQSLTSTNNIIQNTSTSAATNMIPSIATPPLSSYSRQSSLSINTHHHRPATGSSMYSRPSSSSNSVHSDINSRPSTASSQHIHSIRNAGINQPIRASFSTIQPTRPLSSGISHIRSASRPLSGGITRQLNEITNHCNNADDNQLYIIKSNNNISDHTPILSPITTSFILPRPPSASSKSVNGRRRPSATKSNSTQQHTSPQAYTPNDIIT